MRVFLPTKNRACQLQCLLDSISVNCPNIVFNIDVLYKATNKDFKLGYDVLLNNSKKYDNINLNMIPEVNFKNQFLESINSSGKLMLLTDDCIFYRKFYLTEKYILQQWVSNVLCFSFRLGLNTTTQYYVTNEQQDHLNELGYQERGELIKWNWKIRPRFHNYGYAVSWDGHVYDREDLLRWSTNLDFYDLLTFEDKLTKYDEPRSSEQKLFMMSPKKSCIFSNALNSVKDEPILAGTKHYHSVEELNEQFLSGKKINIANLIGMELNSCHEEFQIEII